MTTLLILLAHAFNPLIIAFYISLRTRADGNQRRDLKPGDIIVIILSSLMVYLFWLALHFVVAWLSGRDFSFIHFIGSYQGLHYFFPFIGGFLLLFAESIIRPILHAQRTIEIYRSVYLLVVFLSCYMMLVTYLAALN